jgi:hypothetical protein
MNAASAHRYTPAGGWDKALDSRWIPTEFADCFWRIQTSALTSGIADLLAGLSWHQKFTRASLRGDRPDVIRLSSVGSRLASARRT